MSDLVLNALKRKLVNAKGHQAAAITKRIKKLEKANAPEPEEVEVPAETTNDEGEA